MIVYGGEGCAICRFPDVFAVRDVFPNSLEIARMQEFICPNDNGIDFEHFV